MERDVKHHRKSYSRFLEIFFYFYKTSNCCSKLTDQDLKNEAPIKFGIKVCPLSVTFTFSIKFILFKNEGSACYY